MTTAVTIAPTPILQFFGNDARPCVGGTVLTQVGGVNAATYQDSAGTTPLPNPIPLNNRGEVSNASGVSCQLFIPSGVAYTFTLYDASGNQLNQAATVLASDPLISLAAVTGSSLIGFEQSLTGSVPMTVQTKLRQVINVDDLGAAGDGATDDRPAIQGAINALSAVGGGTLTFTLGKTYLVSSSGNVCPGSSGNYCLLIPSNISLVGPNKLATIKSTTDAVTVICAAGASSAAHVTGIDIDGLNIQAGDSTNNGLGRGVFFFRADSCSLRNTVIRGARLGFQVDRLSADAAYNTDITLENVTVRDTFGTAVGNGSGFFISGTDGFQGSNLKALNIAEHGIYINQNTKNVTIDGIISRPKTNANGNCCVQIFTSAATPDISGIALSNVVGIGGKFGALASTTGGSFLLDLALSNARFTGQLTNGVLWSQVQDSSMTGVKVSQCSAGGGIEIDGGRNISAANCHSKTNGSSGWQLFATTDSSFVSCHAHDNDQLNSTNYGWRVASASTGNRFDNCSGCDYQGSHTQKYGWQFDASSTGCSLTDPIISGNVTGDILDQVPATPLSARTLIRTRTSVTYQEVLAPGGQDIQLGKALTALGGGATPTLGTIGAAGPGAAAQNTWMKFVDASGAGFYVPVWK